MFALKKLLNFGNFEIKFFLFKEIGNFISGLLIYTERQNENNPDEIINYLSIGLKNGHVIYRYNIGAGPGLLIFMKFYPLI